MTTRLLPLLAAFLGAFLATRLALPAVAAFRSRFRGLVGSLYRGRRVVGVRDEGWRDLERVDDEGLFV